MTLFLFLVISRWLYFTAVFVLFGASAFWFYMGIDGIAPTGGLPGAVRATSFLLRSIAPVTAFAGVAWLAGIFANMTGGFDNLIDPATLALFFFQTQFGPLSFIRLGLFVAALLIAILPLRPPVRFLAFLLLGGALLITQAWFGHAAEGGADVRGMTMIIVYVIHVLAGATWVGGLAPLVFSLFELRRRKAEDLAASTLALLSRFSLMGMVAVTLIIVTGVANAAFRVAGDFDKFFFTAYGDVLIVKVALVAVMLALAYMNRFMVMPRLRRSGAQSPVMIAGLRASIAAEWVLGLLVLAAAAVLGITPPPR